MANSKSAKKRIRTNATKAMIGKVRRSELKTVLKKADLAIVDNTADKADVVKFAFKKIDQACANGIIHKNNAARKKSSLATKLNVVAN